MSHVRQWGLVGSLAGHWQGVGVLSGGKDACCTGRSSSILYAYSLRFSLPKRDRIRAWKGSQKPEQI